jgi:hypothetical protein
MFSFVREDFVFVRVFLAGLVSYCPFEQVILFGKKYKKQLDGAVKVLTENNLTLPAITAKEWPFGNRPRFDCLLAKVMLEFPEVKIIDFDRRIFALPLTAHNRIEAEDMLRAYRQESGLDEVIISRLAESFFKEEYGRRGGYKYYG